jgi:hypothetical protein
MLSLRLSVELHASPVPNTEGKPGSLRDIRLPGLGHRSPDCRQAGTASEVAFGRRGLSFQEASSRRWEPHSHGPQLCYHIATNCTEGCRETGPGRPANRAQDPSSCREEAALEHRS